MADPPPILRCLGGVMLILVLVVKSTVSLNHGKDSIYVNPSPVIYNITSAPHQHVTGRLEIDPDSEQITSLPHSGAHSDKVLERLTLTTPQSFLGTSFDNALLDFSAYLTKPFVFDYNKALDDAIEQARSEVLSTNYNLDAAKFEGSEIEDSTETKSEPLQPNRFSETISLDFHDSAPRAEQLVRHLPIEETTHSSFDETKLPLGFAFFDALREQNNRPYFEAFAQTTTQRPFTPTVPVARPNATEVPTTDAVVTVHPSSFYRRRNSEKSSDFDKQSYNSDEKQDQPFFEAITNDHSDESAESDSNQFGEYDHKPYKESEEQQPSYTITNTDTNSYGAKPGMKFNRYSRLKLIQQQKPITKSKPTAFIKKNHSPKRRNSQTASTNYSAVKIASPKSKRKPNNIAKYLYDDEIYHPSESKEFLIVVTTPPSITAAKDLVGAASAQQSWRQIPPRFAALNRPRPQDIEYVHPVTSRPETPSLPRPAKAPPARKPSQQKPPEEMRYFQ